MEAGEAHAFSVGVRTRPLSCGERAPAFSLHSGEGAEVSLPELLSSLRDSGRLLLVFFPFAFSPVCDAELADLDVLSGESVQDGIAVAGVSTDPKYTLAAYTEQHGIGFPLLSDFWPHGRTAQDYGVFDASRGMALRGTFLVDTEGVIKASAVGPVGARRDFRTFLAATTGA